MAAIGPERATRCLWCGAITVLDIDTLEGEQAVRIIKKHDQECDRNPLVIRNKALTFSIKKIFRGTYLN